MSKQVKKALTKIMALVMVVLLTTGAVSVMGMDTGEYQYNDSNIYIATETETGDENAAETPDDSSDDGYYTGDDSAYGDNYADAEYGNDNEIDSDYSDTDYEDEDCYYTEEDEYDEDEEDDEYGLLVPVPLYNGIVAATQHTVSNFAGLQQLIADDVIQDGDTILLTAAITIPAGQSLDLGLGGDSVTFLVDGAFRHFVVNGTLTLEDGVVLQGRRPVGNEYDWIEQHYRYLTTIGAYSIEEMLRIPISAAWSVGGGVQVGNNGVFNMNGGLITGNRATNINGGGVALLGANSNFNMHGGTISGNLADNLGGGVFTRANDNSIFNMYNGVIQQNFANIHGAILINAGNTFNFHNGIIKDNFARTHGSNGINVENNATVNFDRLNPPAALRMDFFNLGGGSIILPYPYESRISTSSQVPIRYIDGTFVYTDYWNEGSVTISNIEAANGFHIDFRSTTGRGALITSNDGEQLIIDVSRVPRSHVAIPGASGAGTVDAHFPSPSGSLTTLEGSVIELDGGYITLTLPNGEVLTYPTGIHYFVVMFNSNGGSFVSSTLSELDELLAMPTNPTRTGFTFGGWYTDAALTIPWDFDVDTVDTIFTLHAKWVHTVTFLPGASSGVTNMPSNRSVEYDAAISSVGDAVATPSRTGYTFSGWLQTIPAATGNISSANVGNIVVTQNMTFVAQWQPINNNGGGDNGGGDNGGGGNNGGGTLTPPPLRKDPDSRYVYIGDHINWSLRNIHNYTGETVSDFAIVDMPSRGLNFVSGNLPAFTNGAGITFDIRYTVAGSNEWRTYATGVDASQPFSFSLPQPGNIHYTNIGFFFGTVPADFALGNEIVLTFLVTDESPTNVLVNRFALRYRNVERQGQGTANVRPQPPVTGGGNGGGSWLAPSTQTPVQPPTTSEQPAQDQILFNVNVPQSQFDEEYEQDIVILDYEPEDDEDTPQQSTTDTARVNPQTSDDFSPMRIVLSLAGVVTALGVLLLVLKPKRENAAL